MLVLKQTFWISSLLFCFILSASGQVTIGYCGKTSNDIVVQLQKERYNMKPFPSLATAIQQTPYGGAVLVLAEGYPYAPNSVDTTLISVASKKGIRVYIEYTNSLPGVEFRDSIRIGSLERAIVADSLPGTDLKQNDLLGCNDCHFYQTKTHDPILVIGKVAGFDRAEFGTADIETFPLLFEKDNLMIATTKLSNFCTGRYGPAHSWQSLWEFIVGWITATPNIHFKSWISDVSPSYSSSEALPLDAGKRAIEKGISWYFGGHFFVDSSWKSQWLNFQGDGTNPVGPPVDAHLPNGDGSLGILEGHASRIYFDGTEQYRYWMRNDVQGEVSFALASGAHLLNKPSYFNTSLKLGDFIFHYSNFRAGAKGNKDSAVFGLLGWAYTHDWVFYNDDNARSMLGLIGASAYLKTSTWDREIAENILANLRTSSRQGFQGERLEEEDVQKNGWQYYSKRDLVNPAPHFESWMWACYLWLYDKTGYKPLLEKAKSAIRLTMEAYPDKWKWTNGIQQERARMILPLAWLVQIENTAEHRGWLDKVVSRLLENQDSSGAVREELGEGGGAFGRMTSNKDYGTSEASLIFRNGDPVADMLYTSNFAFFSLNEAAHATGEKRYKDAVRKLSDFLIRIQVKSQKHMDLDGAWFRAFDFRRWDYWASNADLGWGAWSTLTGWIQSWIISTQVLVEEDNCYWSLTKKSSIRNVMPETIRIMFPH